MPTKSRKKLFDPASTEPFPLSRSKLECHVRCGRCLWLDRRKGVSPPGIPALVLNSLVGRLLGAEFDACRKHGVPHPLMVANGLDDVVPWQSDRLAEWRQPTKGIRFVHEPTNLLVYGAPDDIWINEDGKLIVVDYKATASRDRAIAMDTPYRMGYARQVQVYRWLLERNGHAVSGKSYLVFANARVDRPSFDARLDFDLSLVEVLGDTSWIEPTLVNAKACLMSNEPPKPSSDCEACNYAKFVADAMEGHAP